MRRAISAVASVGFAVGVAALAGEAGGRLSESVALAIQGQPVSGVQEGRHGFDLKPIGTDGSGKKVIIEMATGWFLEGSFHHRIVSKNDVVYYAIIVERGKPPRGVITNIKYRGILENPVIRAACKIVDVVSPGAGEASKKLIGGYQKWKVGSWEASAQTILDEMAAQLARRLEAGLPIPR